MLRQRATGAVLAACLAATVGACAPQAPDHSSWRDQAHLSVEDVAGNISTMTLLMSLVQQDRMFGKYQQIVALNSETNAGRTTDHLSGEQPLPRDDQMYTRVTSALSDACDLISEVRIALVRRDSGKYDRLAQELSDMTKRLDRVETAVRR